VYINCVIAKEIDQQTKIATTSNETIKKSSIQEDVRNEKK